MRKDYYVIIFIFLSTIGYVKAQNKIFPDSFAIWQEFVTSEEDPQSASYSDKVYFMYGDTLVDGVNYKNLYFLGATYAPMQPGENLNKFSILKDRNPSGKRFKIGLLRKDGKRVFYRQLDVPHKQFPIEDEKDYLLFNLGWTVGDTIFSIKDIPSNRSFVVITKDTVIQGIRALMISSSNSSNKYENILFDGLGFSQSIFYRFDVDGEFNNPSNHNFFGSFGIGGFCSENYSYNFFNQLSVGGNCNESLNWALKTIIPKQNTITVYPNPVKDYLYLDKLEANTNIALTDMTGKLVKQVLTASNEWVNIEVTDLSRGVYLLQVQSRNTVFVNKIIKE